jgi:hypothetical protein
MMTNWCMDLEVQSQGKTPSSTFHGTDVGDYEEIGAWIQNQLHGKIGMVIVLKRCDDTYSHEKNARSK